MLETSGVPLTGRRTHKHIRDAILGHNILNLQHQKRRNQGHTSQTNHKCQYRFRECEFLLCKIAMAVQIVLFVLLEHFRDQVVVRGHLEVDVDGVCD